MIEDEPVPTIVLEVEPVPMIWLEDVLNPRIDELEPVPMILLEVEPVPMILVEDVPVPIIDELEPVPTIDLEVALDEKDGKVDDPLLATEVILVVPTAVVDARELGIVLLEMGVEDG